MPGYFINWAVTEIRNGNEEGLNGLVDSFIYSGQRAEAIKLLREITEILDSDPRIEQLPKVAIAVACEDQESTALQPDSPEAKLSLVAEKVRAVKQMVVPKRVDEAVNKAMAGVGPLGSEMSGQQQRIRDSKVAVARQLPRKERKFWDRVVERSRAILMGNLTEDDLIQPDPEILEEVRRDYSPEAIHARRGNRENSEDE